MYPTLEQLHTFHARERYIFSKLVLQFSRSPAESLLVIATWLWLEEFGFENIFPIMMAFADPIIVALANEAVSCFRCLESNEPPYNLNNIPLTTYIMKKDISLLLIYKHRYSAITGIQNLLTTVCSRIFSDILQRVLPSSSSSSSFLSRIPTPLTIPGFPHPIFGSINIMPNNVFGNNLPNNILFPVSNGIWERNANCIATENDRTLFITFSRGFYVSQDEVKEFFTMMYGERCVEGVFMPNGEQPLFARLVLDSVATVDRILNGENLKKFQFNGKPIWARKYEKRDRPT